MRPFGDWIRDLGVEPEEQKKEELKPLEVDDTNITMTGGIPPKGTGTITIHGCGTKTGNECINPKSHTPIENQTGQVYNEWGNLEPNQGLIDDIMLDDGWMPLEAAQAMMGDNLAGGSCSDDEDDQGPWKGVF